MPFILESPAFDHGDEIPWQHVRDGDNRSPPLTWRDAPAEVGSFVLIVEDPDAPSGTFRHWAVYNISGDRSELPEAVVADAEEGFGHGVNDFGNRHYDGPQPPAGHGVHHYHFRLAALDVERLDLPPHATVEDVWKAAEPHIVAEAELIGVFENPAASA